MDGLDVAALLMVSFWPGFGYRVWGERIASRRAKTTKEPEIHPSWGRMAVELVDHMRWVRDAHKFAGDDVEARWDSIYSIKGLGDFRIVITRAEPSGGVPA